MAVTGREMISVGIDVGTTTTQIVFSRLQVQDVARLGQVPRLQVNAKDVLYQSPITFTPLLSPEEVDVPALTAIVREEYRRAGFASDEVETGAVIVTGEIARARNANAILKALAPLAGDFVVTVAGPNVESQIAGRGGWCGGLFGGTLRAGHQCGYRRRYRQRRDLPGGTTSLLLGAGRGRAATGH